MKLLIRELYSKTRFLWHNSSTYSAHSANSQLKKNSVYLFCNFTLEMAQNKNETSTNLSVQNVATLNGHSRVSRVKKKLPLPTKNVTWNFVNFFIGLNFFALTLNGRHNFLRFSIVDIVNFSWTPVNLLTVCKKQAIKVPIFFKLCVVDPL